MLEAGAFDLVLTDPPYGINTKSDGQGKLSPWADLCNSSMWYEWWLGHAKRMTQNGGACWSFLNWRSIVTFQKASCDLGWPIESLLVWDKCWIGPGGPNGLRPSYEMVALWCGGGFTLRNRSLPDIQRFSWSSHKPNGHPAEKPLDLVRWLVCESNGQAVLDPFAGSGTTGVAAKLLGRRALLVEIEERWVKVAAERLRQGVLL